jgi:carboxymethylenebutenolidase
MDTAQQDTRLSTDTPAVVVRPTAGGSWPGVVMLHEAWGVDDVLLRQAHRLASAGYLVLAPDLFADGNRLKCIVSTVRALQAESGRPFELIEAARQRLHDDAGCTGQVGVIGFCLGGGFALLLGGRGFDASAVNYGPLPKDLDAALGGSCPVVGSYGGLDRQLSPQVPRLEEALTRLNVPHDVKVYPTAGHSFLNDAPNGPRLLRPLLKVFKAGPEPVAAADAWQRIEAFFGEHLGPRPSAEEISGS